MSKPSIFSKDYQKRMRRRRAGFALLIVAVVIVAAAAFMAGKSFLSKNNQGANNTASVEDTKDQTTTTNKTTTDQTTTGQTAAQTPKEEGFDFKLADGTSLKAVYTTDGTAKKFQYVSPKEKNVYYNINPAGDKMLVFDSGAQSIMLIDSTGKVQDITNPTYTSSKGTVIKKENVLSSNSSYMWCSSPAFISDTKAVYVTQLPWMDGRSTKYVWKVDLTTGKHTTINNVHGEKITFGKIESKGLTMNVDDSVFYITAAGSVVQ